VELVKLLEEIVELVELVKLLEEIVGLVELDVITSGGSPLGMLPVATIVNPTFLPPSANVIWTSSTEAQFVLRLT